MLISLETRALAACTQVILQKVHLQQPCYDFCFLERSNIGQICSQYDTTPKHTGFLPPRLGRGGPTLQPHVGNDRREAEPRQLGLSFFAQRFGDVFSPCGLLVCAHQCSPLVFITSSSVATTGGVYKWQRHQSAQANDLFVLGIPL